MFDTDSGGGRRDNQQQHKGEHMKYRPFRIGRPKEEIQFLKVSKCIMWCPQVTSWLINPILTIDAPTADPTYTYVVILVVKQGHVTVTVPLFLRVLNMVHA